MERGIMEEASGGDIMEEASGTKGPLSTPPGASLHVDMYFLTLRLVQICKSSEVHTTYSDHVPHHEVAATCEPKCWYGKANSIPMCVASATGGNGRFRFSVGEDGSSRCLEQIWWHWCGCHSDFCCHTWRSWLIEVHCGRLIPEALVRATVPEGPTTHSHELYDALFVKCVHAL